MEASASDKENAMRLQLNPSHATGIFDKVVGLNKEIAGELFDRSSLREAGQLQQEKGSAKLSALRAEATAEAEKAKAKSLKKAQEKVEDAS
jgi:hypothetical protein